MVYLICICVEKEREMYSCAQKQMAITFLIFCSDKENLKN